MNKNFLSIAVFQGKIQVGNFEKNFTTTLEQLAIAESKGIDILCMPESYLHGYFESKEDAFTHSLDLNSNEYLKILERLKPFNKTTLLVGINERCEDKIYNTVLVIEKGVHIGKYRKAYTYPPV